MQIEGRASNIGLAADVLGRQGLIASCQHQFYERRHQSPPGSAERDDQEFCFCAGCAALTASMMLDGFATPAIAVRFAGVDDLQPAKTLFILLGTLIRFLMPMGLLFQFVAMLSWSWAIVKRPGLGRGVGVLGSVVAIILIVAIFAIPTAMAAHVILGGIVLQSIWYLAIAALLLNRASWPLSFGSKPT